MSNANVIIDTPLPEAQDFKFLRKEGLAYIQEYSGNEWTNLNPSDPGVTILDQLCFALTELGYCNDFPVSDILTRPDGDLNIRDQFYLPENILTTSPVTADDYRKYIIDGISAVKNVVIFPERNSAGSFTGLYTVYLLIDTSVDSGDIWKIRKAAFFYLNKRRNIGEMFAVPKSLQAAAYTITGRLDIDTAGSLTNILVDINNRIRNYIFPEITPVGYDQLSEQGALTNEIFNGPLLENGYIATASLGEKRDRLVVTEIANLMAAAPGVISAPILNFKSGELFFTQINSNPDEILTIDLLKSIGDLEIYCKGVKIPVASITNLNLSSPALNVSIVFGSSLAVQTAVPKGRYRDLNSYYSIQNTFPEIFAVGADAANANAPDLQIAQSKQLKGYLTLFDQVLANQFSQLANVDRLFSFKNSMTGAPSDEEAFYAVQDAFEKHHLEYPVPYMRFSPTYFYQSLYNVPHIKPLLKDTDTFNFSSEIPIDKELEQKSWVEYQRDPYNPYMRGLMEFMEDERTSLDRRNEILDHLLARHGESPLIVNTIISGSVYSNDTLKDLVIYKSLYLQNLGLLSYFRQKAYNCLGANRINNVQISRSICESFIAKTDPIDFIFNSKSVDQMEKLTESDFVNYSAVELKLSLLLGLKTQYINFISESSGGHGLSQIADQELEKIKLTIWMIRHRRGLILIETGFLFHFADPASYPVMNNQVELIFPDFIPQFKTEDFKNRLKIFLQAEMPVQVVCNCRFVDSGTLKKLIPAFVHWHNNLRYHEKKQFPDQSLVLSARELAEEIIKSNNN